MEADERPSKIRRVEQDESQQAPDANLEAVPPSAAEPDAIEKHEIDDAHDATPIALSTTALDTGSVDSSAGVEARSNHPDQITSTSKPPKPSQIPDPQSKNQQKKLRKKLEWEAQREERKAIKKEKVVARRERKRAAKQAQEADPTFVPEQPVFRKAIQLPITFIIDCNFDDLMRDNERISLASQLTR